MTAGKYFPEKEPHMDLASRLHHATVAAQQAFWAKIVEAFPEVSHSEFPPESDARFDDACIAAAWTWVKEHYPRNVQPVTLVASDTCLPLQYHADALLLEGGRVVVISDYRNESGTPLADSDESGAIDISHVLLADGTERSIDPATLTLLG